MKKDIKTEVLKKQYRPSKVSKILVEKFGHRVTPSVIRKWDNHFEVSKSHLRKKGNNRLFNLVELNHFNLIAVLRSLGYDLEEIKILFNSPTGVLEIKNRILRFTQGLTFALAELEEVENA